MKRRRPKGKAIHGRHGGRPREDRAPAGTRRTVGLLIFILLSLPAAAAGNVAGDSDSLESLLNSVDQALEQPEPPAPPKRPTAPVSPTSPRQPKRSSRAASPAARPTPAPPPVGTASPKLYRLLSLGPLEEARVESVSTSAIALGAGVKLLREGLTLHKDDDTFRLSGTGSLKGLSVRFSPAWRLGAPKWLPFDVWGAFAISGGFFAGDLDIERSGVISDSTRYGYYAAPLTLELGLQWGWRRWTLQTGYAYGWTVVSQRGLGQTDTVTGILRGDEAVFGLTWRASASFSVFSQVRIGSLDLFGRPSGYAGNTLLLGIQTTLSGES